MTFNTIRLLAIWSLLIPSTACYCQSADRNTDPVPQTKTVQSPTTQTPVEESVKPGINDKFISPDLGCRLLCQEI